MRLRILIIWWMLHVPLLRIILNPIILRNIVNDTVRNTRPNCERECRVEASDGTTETHKHRTVSRV